MKQYDLSILIPARNEMFLATTVNDILSNIEGNTEIIVVLDGAWDDPKVPEDPRVTVVYQSTAIGQRASTNKACRLSSAKYVMKCDAHVAFDKGFDVKLIKAMEGHDDWTVMPRLYNLHVFDWKCNKCGSRWYQGPTPRHCMVNEKDQNPHCDNTSDFERVMVWKPRMNRRSDFMRFDNDLHFQYFSEFGKRPEAQGEIADLMSLLGACFMLTRERYWDLNICDEEYGSWGGQGTEVACKSWLSGGRLVVYKGTWYSHLFRTQGGDFGFPYVQSGKQIEHARQMNRDYWFNNSWPKQTRPLSWLVEKFWPVPGWTDEDLKKIQEEGKKFYERAGVVKSNPELSSQLSSKGIIFYTDNQLNLKIAHRVQKQLKNIGLPIVSASLKPMDFGKNIHLNLKRGYLTMAKQILSALEASDSKYIFFCEHDVIYHESHFDFTPPRDDVFYYNTNVWKTGWKSESAFRVTDCKQLSGLCANREFLIKHFIKRLEKMEDAFKKANGNDHEFASFVRAMGFEPGTHHRDERVDDFGCEGWESEYPNIDIRHDSNLTATKWSQDQFRNKKFADGWTESNSVPGWGLIKNIF